MLLRGRFAGLNRRQTDHRTTMNTLQILRSRNSNRTQIIHQSRSNRVNSSQNRPTITSHSLNNANLHHSTMSLSIRRLTMSLNRKFGNILSLINSQLISSTHKETLLQHLRHTININSQLSRQLLLTRTLITSNHSSINRLRHIRKMSLTRRSHITNSPIPQFQHTRLPTQLTQSKRTTKLTSTRLHRMLMPLLLHMLQQDRSRTRIQKILSSTNRDPILITIHKQIVMFLPILNMQVKGDRLINHLIRSNLRRSKRHSSLTRQTQFRTFTSNTEHIRLNLITTHLMFINILRNRCLTNLSILSRHRNPHHLNLLLTFRRHLLSMPISIVIRHRHRIKTIRNLLKANRHTKSLLTTIALLMSSMAIHTNRHKILRTFRSNSTLTKVIRTTRRHTRLNTINMSTLATRLTVSRTARVRIISNPLSHQHRILLRSRMPTNTNRFNTRHLHIRLRRKYRRANRTHKSLSPSQLTISLITRSNLLHLLHITISQLRLQNHPQINSSHMSLSTLHRRNTIHINSLTTRQISSRLLNPNLNHHLYNRLTICRLSKNRLRRTYKNSRHRCSTSNSTLRRRLTTSNRPCRYNCSTSR